MPSVRVTAYPAWPAATQEWEPDADVQRKIEVLHRQHDLLLQDVSRFRDDAFERFEALQADLSAAEARFRATREALARSLEAKDRRAAQIDARGLWPIGFGIVLTGIPAELAHFYAVGIVIAALGIVLTVSLALAGILARRGAKSGARARARGSQVA